jgi:hypothetical protein
VSAGLRWGFILSPSARTGPSRLGPAGEGRSDGGVLHLHPQGQARYPEGGRRREDEPPGKGWRVRANTEETSSTRAMSPWRAVQAGALPPCVGLVGPAVSPPDVLADAAGSSLHQLGGTPHPCDRRAISVQLAPATSGLSRSLADTPIRRSGHVERRSRTDSQADSTTAAIGN